MNAIIAPLLSANGSDKEALMRALLDASTAVQHAKQEMAKCFPHGRDYLPYGESAMTITDLARDRHAAEVRKLVEVGNYLQAIAVAIAGQGK